MAIHPSAVIDPAAKIHPTAEIGPHVVIDGPVRIEAGCHLGPSAIVLGHTEIGENCRIHSHAVIGDTPQDRAYEDGPSYCRVGRDCVIREGVTIHRGTAAGSTTLVGDGCLLMTNSHVAHNCTLGNNVTLVSGALLGGQVQVDKGAIISGSAGVHQHVRVGELALVSVLCKVTQDVPPFFIVESDSSVVGVNRVGLIRANFTLPEREEIKRAYRILYRSGLGSDAAIDALSETVTTEAGRRLLDFMVAGSSRGISRRALSRRAA
jgi:UDP-N-acetylglucosamine acyltransferase